MPEGDGGGAEKFLWLAQLCDNGGYESIAWFEKGLSILERELRLLDDSIQLEGDAHVDRRGEAEEKRRKVAAALCGMVEVWMTDLSYVFFYRYCSHTYFAELFVPLDLSPWQRKTAHLLSLELYSTHLHQEILTPLHYRPLPPFVCLNPVLKMHAPHFPAL